MNRVEKTVFILITLVILGGLISGFSSAEKFNTTYAPEDGMIEWATVFALAFGGFLQLYRALLLRKNRSKLCLAVIVFSGLVFLFGAGEEISWGQRIFDIETPKTLQEYNSQGELNLHNVKIGQVKLNKIIFSQLLAACIIFYLTMLPVLYSKIGKIRSLTDNLAIPIATVYQIVFYIVSMAAILIIPAERKWEVMEFSGSLTFALILLYPKNTKIYL